MNGSWYRRLLLVPLTVLISLTLVTSVLAAKPDMVTFQVDYTFLAGSCDGFEVIEHVEGTVKVSTHFNRDGTPAMEIVHFSLRLTYTNSVTGASLSSPDVGIDKLTVNDDGSGTLAVVGIVGHITVPGEGLVFAHLGRILFDLNTGEAVFVGGPHEDFNELQSILCSALG